jgi:hypothetical protein
MYRELRRHDGLTAEDMRFFNFYSVLGGDGSIRLAPAA